VCDSRQQRPKTIIAIGGNGGGWLHAPTVTLPSPTDARWRSRPSHRTHGGAVLGTAIDKGSYHFVTRLYSPLFDYSIRIAYSRVECVASLDDVQHAPVRACLRFCGIERDIEVSYSGELPSFSGLGTSSAFVVGLLNALHAYLGRPISNIDLARAAIHIEQDILGECVGSQDQTLAALGGFNVIEFHPNGDIFADPVRLPPARWQALQDHLLLFDSGIRRRAADFASRQMDRCSEHEPRLKEMRAQVDLGYSILTGNQPLSSFGELLHQAWTLKMGLHSDIAPPPVTRNYQAALDAGALGGKLLGAGGGGFLLLFVPPERQPAVRLALAHCAEVPIAIGAPGSSVLTS